MPSCNRFVRVLTALALLASSSCGAWPDHHRRRYDWSWLENTYWYVPADGLAAVESSLAEDTHTPISDQTVWHITNYADGYLWGDQVVKTSSSDSYICMNLVGSITPEGDIQITFTFALPENVPAQLNQQVNGLGTMRFIDGQWKAEMQMTTGVTSLITHWAYMTECRDGQPCNQQLPGSDLGLQDFLNQCPCDSEPFCP